MKKLPETVMVYQREWKIIERSGMDDAQGLCNPELREIYINKEYSIEEKISICFHELIHACLYEGGVTHTLKTGVEEAVVCCLENGIWAQTIGFKK